MSTEKRKKRKPTKLEQRIKLVEAVPAKDRWWSAWGFEPSHTVASFVSETPSGGVTEEIWNYRIFERKIRRWMVETKDNQAMQPGLFLK
jgi:hypothetical protein